MTLLSSSGISHGSVSVALYVDDALFRSGIGIGAGVPAIFSLSGNVTAGSSVVPAGAYFVSLRGIDPRVRSTVMATPVVADVDPTLASSAPPKLYVKLTRMETHTRPTDTRSGTKVLVLLTIASSAAETQPPANSFSGATGIESAPFMLLPCIAVHALL